MQCPSNSKFKMTATTGGPKCRRTTSRLVHLVAILAVLCSPIWATAQAPTTRGYAPTTLLPTIPIFPLQDIMLFPRATRPLHVFEQRYRDMVSDALEGDRLIWNRVTRMSTRADHRSFPSGASGSSLNLKSFQTAGTILCSEV